MYGKGCWNMIVNIIQKAKIRKVVLPEKVYGVYSILDDEGKMLVNIEANDNNEWILKANNYVDLTVDGKNTNDVKIEPYSLYTVKIRVNNELYEFIPTPTFKFSFRK